ncbi:MAG: cyanate hydratase, partial [Gammaproteobacteria bacterium]|nr:cyanate hydratase [Gammaproteobacteria bacterium]
MNKLEMTETIMAAKTRSGLGWEAIASQVGLAPVFITSACLGMNSLKAEPADKLCQVLGLPVEVSTALQAFPHKSWDKTIPTDPVIYRLYEVVGVYGDTIK